MEKGWKWICVLDGKNESLFQKNEFKKEFSETKIQQNETKKGFKVSFSGGSRWGKRHSEKPKKDIEIKKKDRKFGD